MSQALLLLTSWVLHVPSSCSSIQCLALSQNLQELSILGSSTVLPSQTPLHPTPKSSSTTLPSDTLPWPFHCSFRFPLLFPFSSEGRPLLSLLHQFWGSSSKNAEKMKHRACFCQVVLWPSGTTASHSFFLKVMTTHFPLSTSLGA